MVMMVMAMAGCCGSAQSNSGSAPGPPVVPWKLGKSLML